MKYGCEVTVRVAPADAVRGRGQEKKRRKRKTNALLAEKARYSRTGNSAFGANLKPKGGKVN